MALLLIALGPHGSETRALAAGSRLVIGRGEGCDLRYDDVRLSRKHARVDVSASGEVTVTDLASRNGTLVDGRPACPNEPAAVGVGTAVSLGAQLLVVQDGATSVASPWITPNAFEAHAAATHAEALARISIAISGGGPDASEATTVEARELAAESKRLLALHDVLHGALRAGDVAARMAEDRFDALVGAARVNEVVARLTEGLAARGYRADLRVVPKAASAPATPRPSPSPSPTRSLPPAAMASIASRYPNLDRIANSSIVVLITGETGAGKEVLARTIHALSDRSALRFMAINCAALPENLLESELFGHERGAFTGATGAKIGLLEAAKGGTLLLDEIGDMPLAAQAKLLRAIEEKAIVRLGSVEPRPIDARIIAASNLDLAAAVGAGRFRQDLYFRLNGVSLRVPPLRERLGEIETLAADLLARCAAAGKAPLRLDLPAIAKLRGHDWPGNVRELRNVLERATLNATGDVIRSEHIELEARPGSSPAPPRPADDERGRIVDALARAGGNQTKAAAMLGISRRTLTSRLNEMKLPRPRKQA